MDIKSKLQSEHSKTLTDAIVKYIGDDAGKFKVLMNLFLSDDEPIIQRAAWPLSFVGITHPQLNKPYYPKLIQKLKTPGQHPAVYRNILRLMQEVEIPEKYHSDLIDICFTIIVNPAEAIASRAFAISVATKLCLPFVELRKELLLVFEQLTNEDQKPAIKSRIKKARKDLNRV